MFLIIEGLTYVMIVFENQPVITRTRDGQYGDIFGRVVKSAAGRKAAKEGTRNEGATIDEKCPKCGNPEMTFHTMQLRSADEGQTVFYACPKCSYTYKVNT